MLACGSKSVQCKARLCRRLVENIYSRQVLEEYQRRWDAVRGKAWQRGMIPEYFLRHVTSYSKRHSAS